MYVYIYNAKQWYKIYDLIYLRCQFGDFLSSVVYSNIFSFLIFLFTSSVHTHTHSHTNVYAFHPFFSSLTQHRLNRDRIEWMIHVIVRWDGWMGRKTYLLKKKMKEKKHSKKVQIWKGSKEEMWWTGKLHRKCRQLTLQYLLILLRKKYADS